MPDINLWLFQFLNSLAGHSWWVDSVISLTLANDLLKSALIGACFFGAWYAGKNTDETRTCRRKLLVSLVSAALTLTTTTLISHRVLYPRPYLQAHKVYELKQNQLREMPKLAFHQPLDNRSMERERALQCGNVPPTDLGSFPSDHAGFFVCLSLGIWTASRRFGSIALAWTFLVILLAKLVNGLHMPIEIAVGCLIAALWLYFCEYFSRIVGDRHLNRVVNWTTQYPSLTSAALFIAVFEIASSMDHVKALLSAVGKQI